MPGGTRGYGKCRNFPQSAGIYRHPMNDAAIETLRRQLVSAVRRACPPWLACHLQGYSVAEASGFLGWTKKKTEHLVRRGMADLRSCLAEKGIAP